MKTRKIAIRGLIILFAAAALCMYFSGTVRSIVTPKVRITTARNGKFTQRVELTGKLVYSDTEEITVQAEGQETQALQVYVRAGDRVKEGDLLFSLAVQNEAEREKELRAALTQALDAKVEFERANSGVRLTAREEAYAEAFSAMRQAVRDEAEARMTLDALLHTGENGDAETQEKLKEARADWQKTADALEAEKAAFEKVSRYGIDDTIWNYIRERDSAEEKLSDAQKALSDFSLLGQRLSEIRAPHAGYIVSVSVKTGESYDGKSALYAMTGEDGEPLIEADISGEKRKIAKGDTVYVGSGDSAVKAKIQKTGYNRDTKLCAYIAVSKDMTGAVGSLWQLSSMEIPVQVNLQSANPVTLLPVSALHGSGDQRYVYVIETEDTALNGTVMKVRKMDVTVLDEADGVAALQEELGRYQLAYMEDRELTEGGTVMEYPKQ